MTMKQVVIDKNFWTTFPDAQINLMWISDFDNHDTDENKADRQQLLHDATVASEQFTKVDPFRDNPVVAEWRDAYQQFKKRKGGRSSIEALLKRASQGHEFTPIEPLVDVYNSISLRYGVPLGIEDRDKIVGDLHLGLAQGGESFFPLGAEADDPAREGEMIYYDDEGAVCRSLNWREAQRTMLTEETTNGIVVMESMNADQAARATAAMTELRQLIQHYFGIVPGEIKTLTQDHPTVD